MKALGQEQYGPGIKHVGHFIILESESWGRIQLCSKDYISCQMDWVPSLPMVRQCPLACAPSPPIPSNAFKYHLFLFSPSYFSLMMSRGGKHRGGHAHLAEVGKEYVRHIVKCVVAYMLCLKSLVFILKNGINFTSKRKIAKQSLKER